MVLLNFNSSTFGLIFWNTMEMNGICYWLNFLFQTIGLSINGIQLYSYQTY